MATQPYKVAFLPETEIAARVRAFLELHHSGLQLPIPVEEIAEFNLRINIVPTPGLHEYHSIDGFTSGECKDILIEESVYKEESYHTRYRFTIAHELGHIDLHREFYSGKQYYGVSTWQEYLRGFSEDDHRSFEWQANCYAGMLLMPNTVLKKEARGIYDASGKPNLEQGMEWDLLVGNLADTFCVSNEAMLIRLDRLGIKAWLTQA